MNTNQMQHFLFLCGLNNLFCKRPTEHKTGMLKLQSCMSQYYPNQNISALAYIFMFLY